MTRLHPTSALLGLLLYGFVPCDATAQSLPVQQSRTLRVAGVERSHLLLDATTNIWSFFSSHPKP